LRLRRDKVAESGQASWKGLPGGIAAHGEFAGMLDGLVEAGAEDFEGRKFGEIFAHPNGFGIELEKLHLLDIG
jgi:hypothetical protein